MHGNSSKVLTKSSRLQHYASYQINREQGRRWRVEQYERYSMFACVYVYVREYVCGRE